MYVSGTVAQRRADARRHSGYRLNISGSGLLTPVTKTALASSALSHGAGPGERQHRSCRSAGRCLEATPSWCSSGHHIDDELLAELNQIEALSDIRLVEWCRFRHALCTDLRHDLRTESSPQDQPERGRKGEIAKQLERLGVDVIEAGFPRLPGAISSRAVAKAVHGPLSPLARALPEDILGRPTRCPRRVLNPHVHRDVSHSHEIQAAQRTREVLTWPQAAALAKKYVDDVAG